MQYTIVNEGSNRTAKINGRVTFQEQNEFRALLSDLFDEDVSGYVLDLSGVEHIDSAGLGMFLIGRKRAEEKNATAILRNPPESVKHTLELAKFHELFTIEG